ncbi:MAG: hypothetical protein AAF493_14930 [Pseudomonadota bacterium]
MRRIVMQFAMLGIALAGLLLTIPGATARTLNFAGELSGAVPDGGIFGGTPIGTEFSGFIDDQTFNGEISNGTQTVQFGCCLAAGGLEIDNDFVLDADAATAFNLFSGTSNFSENQIIDGVNIEGDATTASNGRIEVGLSFILNGNAFDNNNLSNYPFDPNDQLLALFFILEQDQFGNDIYEGLGLLTANPIPIPAAWGMLLLALASLGAYRRRRSS